MKQAVAEAVGALLDAFEGDSYAFLATVYKNQALPLGVRLDAAKTAIAYERPRLANVAMVTRSLDQLSDEEFFRAWDGLATFLAQHGRPLLLESADARVSATRRGVTTWVDLPGAYRTARKRKKPSDINGRHRELTG